jgi:hypothetical protein
MQGGPTLINLGQQEVQGLLGTDMFLGLGEEVYPQLLLIGVLIGLVNVILLLGSNKKE